MQHINSMKSQECLEAIRNQFACYRRTTFLKVFQASPECWQQSFLHQHTVLTQTAVQCKCLHSGLALLPPFNIFSIYPTGLAVSSPWPITSLLSSLLITSDIQLACFDNLISKICVLIWPQPVREGRKGVLEQAPDLLINTEQERHLYDLLPRPVRNYGGACYKVSD